MPKRDALIVYTYQQNHHLPDWLIMSQNWLHIKKVDVIIYQQLVSC